MRERCAGVVVAALVTAVATVEASAEPPACRFMGADRVRVGARTSSAGDLVANDAGGDARLDCSVLMSDGTRVAGDSVTLRAGTSVFDVLANDVDAGSGAEVRGTQATVTLPLVEPYCPMPAATQCSGPDLVVASGATVGPLAPGSYGRVSLHRRGTLELAQGTHEFCVLKLGTDAIVRAGSGPASTINVSGRLKLGKRARIEPVAGGAAPTLNVAGRSVRVRNGAALHGFMFAQAARVRLGNEVTATGAVCAASLAIGRDSSLACVDTGCGDGVLDAGEECDAPRDGACLGACRFDCTCPDPPGPWRFTDVTAAAGVQAAYLADFTGRSGLDFEVLVISAGVAAGDYDRDGWPDLYVVGGELGQSRLLRNRGDGTFEDTTVIAGVASTGAIDSGPTFADYDGDGWLDLLVGGHLGSPLVLFHNRGDGTFEDLSAAAGLVSAYSNLGSSFGDYDGDDDLDLFVAHWGSVDSDVLPQFPPTEHLWRNNGDGTFTAATDDAGLDLFGEDEFGFTWTFAATFADVSGDGRSDLLVVSDFGTEQYFLNDGDGTFTEATSAVNSSENGMGSAVADYDNDGDLDWFISSIWDPSGEAEGNWGVTGNRLYRNLGDGTFEDVTDAAGVRRGYWGWGSCFADFNLDGHLDLFHVNGFDAGVDVTAEFHDDPSRLFVADGDGTFTERSLELGIDDRRQGRGIVCFDYDRDGDVDIFIANGEGDESRLYRNDGGAHGGFLQVRLAGEPPNSEAVGARVSVTVGAQTQMREIHAGSNFVSQNPAVAHFGLGDASSIDELRVDWPGGATTIQSDVAPNQFLVIAAP